MNGITVVSLGAESLAGDSRSNFQRCRQAVAAPYATRMMSNVACGWDHACVPNDAFDFFNPEEKRLP
jgi:hypothetical protein